MMAAATPDRTPLENVLEQQDVDELLRLLDAGADVNERTAWGSLLKRTILAFEAHPRLHVTAAVVAAAVILISLCARCETCRAEEQRAESSS
jgi:hypothetical protein